MQRTTFGAVLALTAACSPPAQQGSSGGHGGSPGPGASSSSTSEAASSSAVATVGAGGSGGQAGTGGAGGAGGGAFVCNPPAAAGSLWATQGLNYPDYAPESMCQYRGDVLLIVNTADV
jgi:hypothetical protein